MSTLRRHRLLIAITACLLLVLLTSCGESEYRSQTTSPRPASSDTQQNSSVPNEPSSSGLLAEDDSASFYQPRTSSMPKTTTSCPQPFGTVRAPVTQPLALGAHATIAYIFNRGNLSTPSQPASTLSAELRRYDLVTGKKIVIVHEDQANIAEAQVSKDGQWLLFLTNTPTYAEIQMVRMDGEGLQTLFCSTSNTLASLQWSPDQRLLIFSARTTAGLHQLLLIDLTKGSIQNEFSTGSSSLVFEPRTWPDNSRVYIRITSTQPMPTRNLYILDTQKGANQSQQDLITIVSDSTPSYCWNFDSDYSGTLLLTSSCTVTFPAGSTDRGIQSGPGNISSEPINGGPQNTVFSSSSLAIAQVRFLSHSSTKLLFTVDNHNFGADTSVDTSLNGLWSMNLDGSGTTRLTNAGDSISQFNLYSQYPWSTISLDNQFFALQTSDSQGKDRVIHLIFGSLMNNTSTIFAFAYSNSETVALAGWTTM